MKDQTCGHSQRVFSCLTSLRSFTLYKTKTRFYLVGNTRSDEFKILRFTVMGPGEGCPDFNVNFVDDRVTYTEAECLRCLDMIHNGNKGGLTLVRAKLLGLLGFVRFPSSIHAVFVSKKRKIGSVGMHTVYGVDETAVLQVGSLEGAEVAAEEGRYRQIFSATDLSKDSFFSYTYDLTRSLQKNVQSSTFRRHHTCLHDPRFAWNHYMLTPVRDECVDSCWYITLVHGHFQMVSLTSHGNIFTISLIARRSVYFAGTRYLKRGVDDLGRVANDVEVEQIVCLWRDGAVHPGPLLTSFVQMRGSIPLHWSQITAASSPRPAVILHTSDVLYVATALHFCDMIARYGSPIIALDLTKQVEKRPRETFLNQEYRRALTFLNHTLPPGVKIEYIGWDFKASSKRRGQVLDELAQIARATVARTGFFKAIPRGQADRCHVSSSQPSTSAPVPLGLSMVSTISSTSGDHAPTLSSTASTCEQCGCCDTCAYGVGEWDITLQVGVVRTNCIDCLDRTNISQYALGREALGHQLHELSLLENPVLESQCREAMILMDMYESMGHAISLQYGGSLAHQNEFAKSRKTGWNPLRRVHKAPKELFTSISRYYSNTFVDADRQDAINLLLGNYVPGKHLLQLWELDTDYYLHNLSISVPPLPSLWWLVALRSFYGLGPRMHPTLRHVPSAFKITPALQGEVSQDKQDIAGAALSDTGTQDSGNYNSSRPLSWTLTVTDDTLDNTLSGTTPQASNSSCFANRSQVVSYTPASSSSGNVRLFRLRVCGCPSSDGAHTPTAFPLPLPAPRRAPPPLEDMLPMSSVYLLGSSMQMSGIAAVQPSSSADLRRGKMKMLKRRRTEDISVETPSTTRAICEDPHLDKLLQQASSEQDSRPPFITPPPDYFFTEFYTPTSFTCFDSLLAHPLCPTVRVVGCDGGVAGKQHSDKTSVSTATPLDASSVDGFEILDASPAGSSRGLGGGTHATSTMSPEVSWQTPLPDAVGAGVGPYASGVLHSTFGAVRDDGPVNIECFDDLDDDVASQDGSAGVGAPDLLSSAQAITLHPHTLDETLEPPSLPAVSCLVQEDDGILAHHRVSVDSSSSVRTSPKARGPVFSRRTARLSTEMLPQPLRSSSGRLDSDGAHFSTRESDHDISRRRYVSATASRWNAAALHANALLSRSVYERYCGSGSSMEHDPKRFYRKYMERISCMTHRQLLGPPPPINDVTLYKNLTCFTLG
eukprot:Rmarinus@m.26971